MVANAPIFDYISEKVMGMLTDRIFVAHNVNFDHSFIKNELELSGFKWTTRKLCTVLKRFEPKFGLYRYEARNGYQYLAIGKLAKGQSCVELFYSQYDGINLLLSLTKYFGIDHRFCHYAAQDRNEFIIEKDMSSLPDVSLHNGAIDKASDFLKSGKPSFAIIDKGRSQDERSCIWVEKGHFYGMGYVSSDIAFTEAHEIKEYVTPYNSNQYIMQLIYAYANKYPDKIIKLTDILDI